MRRGGLALLAWASLVIGCGQAARDEPGPDATARSEAEAGGKSPAASSDAGNAPRAPRPRARVAKVSVGVHGIAAGEALPERDLALETAQELLLDFDAGARVRLSGPCLLRPAPGLIDALLVRGGTLSVELAPAAPTPHAGFALTTPSATFSLVRGGTFALRNLADGTSVAFVIAGSASVAGAGAAFPESAPALLVAGDRVEVRLDGRLVRGKHKARTLAEAEQAAVALRAPGRSERADGFDALLRARTSALRSAQLRARELTDAHRRALSDEADRRMALQSELANQAVTVARAKLRLIGALAQRRASRLGEAQAGQDPLAAEAEALLEPAP